MPRLLSIENEKILAGWVVFRDLKRLSTHSDKLKLFAKQAFCVNVTSGWITRFMDRNHLSLQPPSSMSPRESDEELRTQGVEFLNKLRLRNKNPDQIVAMDKTSFHGDARYVKNISIKGGGRPRRRNEPRGIKDVVYIALVGNGTVSPLYVETPHGADLRGTDHFLRVIPPMKGKKKDGVGRGEIGMLDWVAEQVQSGFLVPGDLVLVDAEPALSTEGVVFALSSAGVEIDVFPPILGKFKDPCDEYFNSVFKRAYYKSVWILLMQKKENMN